MRLKRILQFLSLTDRYSNLSLTNLSVHLFLIKMWISPFDWTDAVGLIASLLNYGYKRYEVSRMSEKEAISSDVEELREMVTALSHKIEGYKTVQESLEKQAEDTKKLLSTNAIGSAFGVRR